MIDNFGIDTPPASWFNYSISGAIAAPVIRLYREPIMQDLVDRLSASQEKIQNLLVRL
jgi:hypothetical protein